MAKLKTKVRGRNNRGISIIALVIALAIVQLAIDFCVFNLVRILMIERQLNGVCQAASLAGTSILAKLDVSNEGTNHKKLATAQKAACRCAENMILRGHVLGHGIDKAFNVTELSELGKNLKPDSCQYVVTIADPENSYAPVDFGNPSGKTISTYITYGYRPVFLDFLGSLCYAVAANCVSGLPQIDSVLVLDLSASMDDQTVVTFVRREWIHSPLGAGNFPSGSVSPGTTGCGIIQYVSLNCPASPHTISNYLGWSYDIAGNVNDENSAVLDGSLVNALPPQNLDRATSEVHGVITHPMYFDAYLRSHYPCYTRELNYQSWEATSSPYCRALDYATPPGNCDLTVAQGGNGDGFTDLQGNIPLAPHGMGAVPGFNAFIDLVWQKDEENYFGYPPAAPGARNGLFDNDPLPSPDQQTFTDLVVNIADPGVASSNSKSSFSYEQPLRGPDRFVGFSYTFPSTEQDQLLCNQTFNFPNIGVVVEAARGNLENTPVLASGVRNAQAALIDRPVSVDGITFDMRDIELKNGYQRAYQRLAMLYIQPLASVLAASDQGYLEKLHKLADCRFGFVSFSSQEPLVEFSYNHMNTFGTFCRQSTLPNIDSSFYIFTPPYGNPKFGNPVYDSGFPTAGSLNNTIIENGSGNGFRMPRLPLDVNAEHYLDCTGKNKLENDQKNTCLNFGPGANGIYNCRVQSRTDSGEALATAYSMFHSPYYDLENESKCRGSAYKAIILFTDGEPSDGTTGQEARKMLRAAGEGPGKKGERNCNSDGIAIFTIALNLAKQKAFTKLKTHQAMLLTDSQPAEGEPGGIAWRAGQGSRYYPCEDISQLKSIFSDIARKFTQLQQ